MTPGIGLECHQGHCRPSKRMGENMHHLIAQALEKRSQGHVATLDGGIYVPGQPEATTVQFGVPDAMAVIRTYYDGGQEHTRDQFTLECRQGQSLVWHWNGQLWLRQRHHIGELHGPCWAWYETGSRWFQCRYQQGMLHGQAIMWSPKGAMSTCTTWEHGQCTDTEEKRVVA